MSYWGNNGTPKGYLRLAPLKLRIALLILFLVIVGVLVAQRQSERMRQNAPLLTQMHEEGNGVYMTLTPMP
jgi:hypothetical protein